MGRMVMVKCDCGFSADMLFFGATMGYSDIQKHLLAKIRAGHFGNVWKDKLLKEQGLLPDASYRIYQCPKCKRLVNESCLDLYSIIPPYTEEVIYRYKHLCPDCKKKMDDIQLNDDEPERIVTCPKCGDVAIVKFCGWID